MQPQMQETATAANRDTPGVAVDHFAKPAASLTGGMVMRRSPAGAAPAPPMRPDDGTPADREGRLTGLVQTVLARLRALGSGLVPQPVVAGGSRHGLRWPRWGATTAAAIFVCAYFFFMAAIFGGLNFMPPGLYFPQ
jgi:hypothetical protein